MAHLYTYTCIDMFLPSKIYIYNSFFSSINLADFFCSLFFLANDTSRFISFFTSWIFLLQLISVKFTSYRLPQANLLQHLIHFSIRKRQVQKPQLSSISLHIYGMVITFGGQMKKSDNAYGLIKFFMESMLLRLLITYW